MLWLAVSVLVKLTITEHNKGMHSNDGIWAVSDRRKHRAKLDSRLRLEELFREAGICT